MTPRRTAAELRALAALLDNTRAVAGHDACVEIALSQEFAMRFAGACEDAATALDPLFDDEPDTEPERWRQALEHLEWASRNAATDLPRAVVGTLARTALGRE